MIYENPLELIGNTPVIKYQDIYIKYEGYNLTNSIKDRAALKITKEYLNPLKTLVVFSSGNFGISMAAVCAYFKQKLIVILPKNEEKKKQIIESFGAKVLEVDANNMKDTTKYLKSFKTDEFIIVNQFKSLYNPLGYIELVKEIVKDFKKLDYLILGTGSYGTSCMLSRCLKKVYPKIKVIGVTSKKDNRIDGVCSNIKTGLVKRFKEETLEVTENDAINTAKELLRSGYNVGLSTAANIYIAEKIKEENPNAIILVIGHDNAFKYSDRLV